LHAIIKTNAALGDYSCLLVVASKFIILATGNLSPNFGMFKKYTWGVFRAITFS
jgi:hypothetical protein